ncbi:protein EXECUTER 1, chloroplastic isoform X2 [Salvia hispanica]|uniref:protein EXECUTER 1, chloroplastic isoform X2 n=1 Tax=Salvia hispanica TaxID=49212 RepID=UPI002008FB6E|nr:protein EXECUTER 1, chloroplastic isoform X2 [Salvia hispanica]
MASICPPTFPSPRTDPIHRDLNFFQWRFNSSTLRKKLQSGVSLSRVPESPFCCRCNDRGSGGGDGSDSGAEDAWRWDFGIQETVRNAIKRFDGYLSSLRDQRADGTLVVAEKWGDGEEEWDWERWRKHFVEVDEQERIVSILKSQLAAAIQREDYGEAARIKVAIAAAARSDTVGRVMSHLKKSVEEERYGDAALIRDHAGAGLVGWWAGTSDDTNDPYGRIIHISAEYGRYIARSYSPRQLATASVGAPVFEVYLRDNKEGDYKQQAVYLKRKGTTEDVYVPSFKSSGGSRSLDSLDARDNKSKLFERSSEDTEDARLEKKGRMTFTFTVEEDVNELQPGGDGQSAKNKRSKLPGQRSIDNLMLDFVKSIGKGKIPMKVLRDVGELINLTLNQARNSQPLSGSTTFSRIDVSSSSDPLNGLYIGAHGLYSSEVIHMRRRFGQWNEDGNTKKPSKIEFYEYVEAVKLTGDAYVPAGQVAFRAKVGKKYQLPHKGIIPEEFGVIARYRGQGRLAESGFQNPRWVDGELVILDGKYIKGGPVVGFVYWAPEYHFLVFFNRLRLMD